jgi:hypothetical protein
LILAINKLAQRIDLDANPAAEQTMDQRVESTTLVIGLAVPELRDQVLFDQPVDLASRNQRAPPELHLRNSSHGPCSFEPRELLRESFAALAEHHRIVDKPLNCYLRDTDRGAAQADVGQVACVDHFINSGSRTSQGLCRFAGAQKNLFDLLH